ncbi:MAG: YgcG family protein [Bacteroidetes bacterium]|jgi:uncharacterized protein|nr:YgcG family protein [Bacteroidota bacterium]
MPSKPSTRLGLLLLVGLLVLIRPGVGVAQPTVPSLTGRVVDDADILSSTTERTLTALLAAHEDSTSNQVAVLTVSSLEGQPIESYSLDVAETWGLGTAERDNGVLFLVAPTERELRIEVGLGLEGPLPDVTASRIIRHEVVPHFREGNYDAGVLAGTRAVVGALEGTYAPPVSDYSPTPDRFPMMLFGLLFMSVPSLFVILSVLTVDGPMRWFMYFFLFAFFAVGGGFVTGSFWGAVIVLALYTIVYWGAARLPFVKRLRKKIEAGEVKGFRGGSFSSGSSGSSSWSSGSSFSSSSFSGGGGSFGGGGASGSW